MLFTRDYFFKEVKKHSNTKYAIGDIFLVPEKALHIGNKEVRYILITDIDKNDNSYSVQVFSKDFELLDMVGGWTDIKDLERFSLIKD